MSDLVWLVTESDWDEYSIRSIHSTEKGAEDALRKLQYGPKGGRRKDAGRYEVEEWEVTE